MNYIVALFLPPTVRRVRCQSRLKVFMIDPITSSGTLDYLEWGCRLVWSRLGDLGSLDPGSNPGSPTTMSHDSSKNTFCPARADETS
jgi:hypothetical protein